MASRDHLLTSSYAGIQRATTDAERFEVADRRVKETGGAVAAPGLFDGFHTPFVMVESAETDT